MKNVDDTIKKIGDLAYYYELINYKSLTDHYIVSLNYYALIISSNYTYF